MTVGDIVKIKKEWLNSEAENDMRYQILEINTVTNRCHILCLTTSLSIPPIELVGLDMIEEM